MTRYPADVNQSKLLAVLRPDAKFPAWLRQELWQSWFTCETKRPKPPRQSTQVLHNRTTRTAPDPENQRNHKTAGYADKPAVTEYPSDPSDHDSDRIRVSPPLFLLLYDMMAAQTRSTALIDTVLVVAPASSSKNHRRWLIPTALTLLGFGLGFVSWLFRIVHPWWSGALINASVVFLLLVPGEIALRWVRSSVREIGATATNALGVAETARDTADRTERSLADVRRDILERQTDELEAEADVFRSMVSNPSRQSIIDALTHATERELITKAGVRSPVWETVLHYRYLATPASLYVQLEADDGAVLSRHEWEAAESAEHFYQVLVQAVRDAGADLGTGLNDPTQSVEELSKMLVDVTYLRAQELAGYRDHIRRIIERINGWYFTERWVVPADDLHYAIDIDRLNAMDWEEHLRGKKWHDATVLIPYARRMYGIEAPGGKRS